MNSQVTRLLLQDASAAVRTACSSTPARSFSTTSPARERLVVRKLGKDDPLDMKNIRNFAFDDVPTMVHMQIEKERDRLHLLRLIQFQLPQIRKKYPPRYTTPPSPACLTVRSNYMLGEPGHPLSSKAVLTFRLDDIVKNGKRLSSAKQQHKFKLLAGPRWNPDDNSFKISSESLPTFNMNAKWCSDALDRLLAEAEDLTDPMSDIPLDTRHAQARKRKLGKRKATLADFPKEWLPVKKASLQAEGTN